MYFANGAKIATFPFFAEGGFNAEGFAQALAENAAGRADSIITNWSEFFDRLVHLKTTRYSNSLDNFIRAYGPGKIVLFFGSLFATFCLIKGVGSGMKAGKAQKQVAVTGGDPGGGGGRGGRGGSRGSRGRR